MFALNSVTSFILHLKQKNVSVRGPHMQNLRLVTKIDFLFLQECDLYIYIELLLLVFQWLNHI